MHGSADTLVSPLQSKHFYDALKAKKTDVSYVLVEGAHHGDDPWFQQPVIDRVVTWFKAKLGGERPVAGKTADRGANL